MYRKFLIILLIVLGESNCGAGLSNLPAFNDLSVTTDTHLIPVCNFSFYPTRKKIMPTHVLAHVPSCSTDPVVDTPEMSAQKYSTGFALLYISSDDTRAAEHETIAHALIEQVNQQSVGGIKDVMLTVLKRQRKPFYLALLMPGYMVRGKCLSRTKEQCVIQRVSEHAIVTFGEGFRRREIAYQRWLALSSAIGDNGRELCMGIPNVMSPSVQLVDVVGIGKDQTPLNYKVESRRDSDSYRMKTAPAQLSASTCDPEKTAVLLHDQLRVYKEKPYTYRGYLHDLVELVLDNPFLGSVVLSLTVKNSHDKQSTHTFTVLREGGYVKGCGSHYPDTFAKYPVMYRDPSCM